MAILGHCYHSLLFLSLTEKANSYSHEGEQNAEESDDSSLVALWDVLEGVCTLAVDQGVICHFVQTDGYLHGVVLEADEEVA